MDAAKRSRAARPSTARVSREMMLPLSAISKPQPSRHAHRVHRSATWQARRPDSRRAGGRSQNGQAGEKLQSFHLRASRETLTLVIHPENAEGECGIDRRLSLVAADAQYSEVGLSRPQEGARVHGTEGMLQVGAGAQSIDVKAGILAAQHPFQQLLVHTASYDGWLRCGSRDRPDLQHIRLRLSKAQHLQLQGSTSNVGIQHAPDDVALFRPDMKNAPPSPDTEYRAVSKSKRISPVFGDNRLSDIRPGTVPESGASDSTEIAVADIQLEISAFHTPGASAADTAPCDNE